MEISSPSKRRRAESPDPHLPPVRIRQQTLKRMGFVLLRSLDPDAPVATSEPTDAPDGSICLRSDRVYTVGRRNARCEIAFGGDDRCISRKHCQLLLDGSRRKLLLADGLFSENCRAMDGKKEVIVIRHSMNGVFVNGRRIPKGSVYELAIGDEVCFACAKRIHHRGLQCRYGFVVESVAFFNAHNVLDERASGIWEDFVARTLCQDGPVARAAVLLSMCRRILQSRDPVSCIRRSLDVDRVKKIRVFETVGKRTLLATTSVSDGKKISGTLKVSSQTEFQFIDISGEKLQLKDHDTNPRQEAIQCEAPEGCALSSDKGVDKNNSKLQSEKDDCGRPSDGKTFYLNRLEFMDPKLSEHRKSISLPELFHPVRSIVRAFIATFTCDVAWFLSCCEIPNHLPITIACHNSERCWSSSPGSRISMPYSDYPNLVLLYPPFPEEIAFGKDRKKRGVGCHHPKLIVLQRDDNIRVVITSANLVSRQWNNITNTVWWQDFPRRDTTDFSTLLFHLPSDELFEDTRTDFAAQLAGFMASLIADAPMEAYWVTELAKYDFGGAAGYLVASVPGIHIQVAPTKGPKYILSGMKIMHTKSSKSKFVGYVQASVVGLSYRFCTSSDSNGTELKALASYLGKCQQDASGLSEVVLRRITNITADVNAVCVLVSDSDGFAEGANVQLGFLPRDVAKWVSPLSDAGFFSFSAFVFLKEALTAAFGGNNTKLRLILHISQGPTFSDISRLIQPEHFGPLSSLLASVQRCMGLWRLEEVLCRYRWPEALEDDFIYGSSSIGTSVSSQYLASFSAAAGKKSLQFSDSQESDPEWGRWTINHELESPSLRILFPTIERVKNGICGIRSSRCLLAFSEKTWQRLRSSSILHDVIPHPPDRIGYPMHVKVACRRFHSKTDTTSFGWVYCGSHNFSPAAWGHLLQYPSAAETAGAAGDSASSTRLHICNFELGIILVSPPPSMHNDADRRKSNLDDIVLPFVMPPPRYHYNDRPATVQAMRELAIFKKESHIATPAADEAIYEEISDEEEEVVEYVTEEKEEEKIYAEMLWSQVDSSDGQ